MDGDQTVRAFAKGLHPGDSITHDGKRYGIVDTAFGYRVRPAPVKRARKSAGSDGAKPRKARAPAKK